MQFLYVFFCGTPEAPTSFCGRPFNLPDFSPPMPLFSVIFAALSICQWRLFLHSPDYGLKWHGANFKVLAPRVLPDSLSLLNGTQRASGKKPLDRKGEERDLWRTEAPQLGAGTNCQTISVRPGWSSSPSDPPAACNCMSELGWKQQRNFPANPQKCEKFQKIMLLLSH